MPGPISCNIDSVFNIPVLTEQPLPKDGLCKRKNSFYIIKRIRYYLQIVFSFAVLDALYLMRLKPLLFLIHFSVS